MYSCKTDNCMCHLICCHFVYLPTNIYTGNSVVILHSLNAGILVLYLVLYISDSSPRRTGHNGVLVLKQSLDVGKV